MHIYLSSRTRWIGCLAALLAAALAPVTANAQWDLSPAYKAPLSADPWAISSMTNQLPSSSSQAYEDRGWYSIFGFAFGVSPEYNNGLPYFMVAEVYDGSSTSANTSGLVVFHSDEDNQTVGLPLTPLQTPIGLASIGGKIYGAFNGSNEIIQVNPDGTTGIDIGSGLSSVNGLTVNPLTGHLLATNYANNTILDVDVTTRKVITLLTMTGATAAGGIATDGRSIFVDVYTASDGDHIMQFAIPAVAGATESCVDDFGFVYGARGVALGVGGSSGYIYVNCRHGQIFQIDRTTKSVSLLANWYASWHNGGFASADPINGSLLVSGTAIGRLTPPANQSLQYTIPTLAEGSVASGKTMGGTVYLAVPAPVDFNVALTTTSNFTVSPKTVTIKAGTTSAAFQITGGTVSAAAPATLGTSIALPIGTVTQTVQFTVTPH